MNNEFPRYPNESDWLASYPLHPESLDMDLTLENPSPSSATSYEQYPPYQNGSAFIIPQEEDIYAAHARIPTELPTPEGSLLYSKILPSQLPAYHAPAPTSLTPQTGAPQFSPTAQENAMLYTPGSLRDVDEVFDETFGGDGHDFALFPNNLHKGVDFPLFDDMTVEMPSANLGFSQTSQNDLFTGYDWNNNMDF